MFADGMSSQPTPLPCSLSQTQGRHTFICRAIRVGAALWLFGALAAVLWLDDSAVQYDLRVVIPSHVAPGQTLPIRAFLYGDLSSVEGARLVPGTLKATLLAPGLRSATEVQLSAGLAGSFEGMLPVPNALGGGSRVRVVAIPAAGGDPVALVADITIDRDSPAHGLQIGRSLRAMQQLYVGPLVRNGDTRNGSGPDPSVGDPILRIRGGVCVPEVACRIFALWPTAVESGGRLAVRGSRSLQVLDSLWVTSPQGVGLMVASVRIHGPEAHGELVATSSTGGSARAALRLPTALGSQAIAAGLPGDIAGEGWNLAPPETGPCILDVFVEGAWLSTKTYDRCEDGLLARAVRTAALPDLARLQFRRDPYSAAGAAVRIRGRSSERKAPDLQLHSLLRLAARNHEHGPHFETIITGMQSLSREDQAFLPSKSTWVAAWTGFVAAGLEEGIVPLPEARSGFSAAVTAARHGRTQAMAWAALAVLGAGIVLLLNVGVLAARAAAGAETIMFEAGQPSIERLKSARRRAVQLWLSLIALAIAFAVIATYLVLRY